MGIALLSGKRSKDPGTQVGACIVNEKNIEPPYFTNQSIEEFYTDKSDTLYKTIIRDSAFIRIPVVRKLREAKTLEQKAEAAYNVISEIRELRFELLRGDANVFKNGREMSAWLGLVPKHSASGEKKKMLGITKRGDSYLRKLLIQGARSVILSSRTKQDKRSIWIINKYANSGYNKTAVAVANKNTRIIWALLSKKEDYKRAA